METRLQSPSGKEVVISGDMPTVMIGERINPSGGRRKKLTEALANGNMEPIRWEAARQAAAGASIIDVNVQAASVRDEAATLVQVIHAVAEEVDLPISIDTSDWDVLEIALKACPGRPLVNSVNGTEEAMNRVLPLVAEHQAVVISLPIDDEGIPQDPKRRLAVAEKILRRAESFGIPPEDIIMDGLTMTVGADMKAAVATIETINLIRENLDLNMTLGVSNVSFGLPLRETINIGFLYMAIAAGVRCPIVDPIKMRKVVLTADLLTGRDPFADRFTSYYREIRESGEL
jgi:5-methyltetrahydrofolate--homocysteine methyltransferase